eukprot:TRINITY_DN3630_c0_g1_i2.p1 TRINITY_DN3630_c0_g1~~TRINITY_DN3630_c0_g1_i2.p1  ORF type:complete len:292 (-),score=26.97 TRINITY_DN3630_c0_g1_i2:389-1264(-)
MNHFDPTEDHLPTCPNNLKDVFTYPSVSVVFLIQIVLSFVLLTIMVFRYNSIRHTITHQYFSTPEISNTVWILYYFVVLVHSCVDGAFFATQSPTNQPLDESLVILTLIFGGLKCLVLSFALSYQRSHRSAFPPRIEDTSRNSRTPVSWGSMNTPSRDYVVDQSGVVTEIKKKCFSGYALPITILYILYLTTIYCEFTLNTTKYDSIFWLLLLVLYGLQWLPIFLFTGAIISNPNYEEGPSFISRMLLIVGLVLAIVNYIPITTWSLMIPSGRKTRSKKEARRSKKQKTKP